MAQARPLRADAARNRTKILAAAHAQITRHGPDVPMDAIAEAAGMAVGTLYRHYPTKSALVNAVLAARVEQMAGDIEATAARVVAGAHPMSEITALIVRTVESAAGDHAVKAAARALGTAEYQRDRLEGATSALNRLIAAAQADGDLHPDITVDDFILLLATAPLDQPPEVRRRWLTLTLPGFTAARGRP